MNGERYRQARAELVARVLSYQPADALLQAERLLWAGFCLFLGFMLGMATVVWFVGPSGPPVLPPWVEPLP